MMGRPPFVCWRPSRDQLETIYTMKRLLLFLMTVACLPAVAQVSVSSLKVNHMKEPSCGSLEARTVNAAGVLVFRDGRSVWRSGVESQGRWAIRRGKPLASGHASRSWVVGRPRPVSGASAARGSRA